MKSIAKAMSRQSGEGYFNSLLFIVFMIFLFLFLYDPPVKLDEVKRLQVLAEGNEQVEAELKIFLKDNPTPTIDDIRPIKKLVESAALLKEAKTYTGSSQIDNSKVQEYFTDKARKK